jgi:hypothetical protein
MGRPSTFTPEVGAAIVARLKTGEPLTRICADDGMPCDDTVRNWAEADATFSRDIARARDAGFDAIALEALAIADETSNDTVVGERGVETANSEWITRSRLRVDTRLKLLAKWDPKRYGDATTVKHADANGEALPVDDIATMTRLASLATVLAERLNGPADEP